MRRALATVLLLAGCAPSQTDPDQRRDIYVRQNPIGRYQMVAVQRNGVGVIGIIELDTREGTVRYCQPKPVEAGAAILEPDCSGDSETMNTGT